MVCPHTGGTHDYIKAGVCLKTSYPSSDRYEVLFECELCGATYTTFVTVPHDAWEIEGGE